ncbi:MULTISPECIES: hypothetical protein [unclassified Wolbachia]|uniref:hypothetical protein n=1 Tax=unclassified Wolbachia TaxID=2640676 RepID=UPI002231D825|nr:hypothetical protein [Wolbachia endosymbiont (group A) of Apoderus coryli]
MKFMPLTTLYNATYSTFNTYAQRPYDVIPVLDTGIQKSLLVHKQTSMESS